MSSLTYADAGVNITEGDRFVDSIKPLVRRTHRPGVLGNIGGFGGLFELPSHYRQPVLVSGTDGVGTKLKLAVQMAKHDTIGIDLVAMCVNDVLTLGAEPLFFLDYFATGKLCADQAAKILEGIVNGCEQAQTALIGGETAEMPGVYQGDDYDLAGFCVGVVEKSAIIDGSSIEAQDVLIGLASSGPHSNGYSLIRYLLDQKQVDLSKPSASSLGDTLLRPTRIYVRPIRALIAQYPVQGLVHITGGGLLENIPRILPKGLVANIDLKSWMIPDIFQWIQREGQITQAEMFRTFNMGVGMVIMVRPDIAQQCVDFLNQHGESAWILGEIISTQQNKTKQNESRVLLQ
jgi:phosphoribosylformylglycinamidine cyclo-ligase